MSAFHRGCVKTSYRNSNKQLYCYNGLPLEAFAQLPAVWCQNCTYQDAAAPFSQGLHQTSPLRLRAEACFGAMTKVGRTSGVGAKRQGLADYRPAAFRRRARKPDIRTGLLDLLRDLAVTQHGQALLSGDPDRPFNLRYDAGSG